MRALTTILMLMMLGGCRGGELFPKGYGQELAYQCEINPYAPDCLQPPPIFNGP